MLYCIFNIYLYFKLVTKNKIRLIFVYTAASLISEILYEISKIKKIKFITLNHSRFLNYYIPINNNQEYPEKLIKYYNKNKKPSNYLCNKLFNKYIDSIKSNNNILNRHNNLRINQKK